MSSGRAKYGSAPWLLALAASALAFALYLPALRHEFVNFDDYDYVTKNPYLGLPFGDFIKWAFSSYWCSNWHPVTWLSLRLDHLIWGLNPTGYHLTNIVLHAANTFMTALVAHRLFGFVLAEGKAVIAAATVALLFAVHPLHVESVAWVSERKDVLYAFFFLSSLWFYISHAAKPRRRYYLLAVAAFSLSVMSKPMAVTLPVILLIIDYYPLGRLKTASGAINMRALRDKLPFVALSLIGSVMTLIAQRQGIVHVNQLSFIDRALIAIEGLFLYLGKAFLPVSLSPFYPLPKSISMLDPVTIFAAALFTALTVASILLRRRQPALAAAWGYMFVSLVPVLGLVQVGAQAAADRYMYLPLLGPLFLLGAVGVWFHDRVGMKWWLAANIAAVTLLSVATLGQTGIWRSSTALWQRVVENHPQSSIGYSSLGYSLYEKGLHGEALANLDKAVDIAASEKIGPSKTDRYVIQRGKILLKLKRYDEAYRDMSHAIELRQDDPDFLWERGNLLLEVKRFNEALADFSRAVSLDNRHVPSLNSMGQAYLASGQYVMAIQAFGKALEIEPQDGSILANLGIAHEYNGEPSASIQYFQRAARLGFGPAQAYLHRKGMKW